MNRTLRYLLVGESFYLLAAGLFGPIYAIFVAQIGGDLLAAGTAYAAFAFTAGFMTLFISRWEDHVNHKEKLILIGHVIGAAAVFGYIFVSNPVQLFIIQFLLGLSKAVGKPAFDGLYSRHLDRGKLVSEWGLYDSMSFFTIGISAAVGGIIVTMSSFQVLFLFMFFVSLVSIAVSLKLMHLNYSKPSE